MAGLAAHQARPMLQCTQLWPGVMRRKAVERDPNFAHEGPDRPHSKAFNISIAGFTGNLGAAANRLSAPALTRIRRLKLEVLRPGKR